MRRTADSQRSGAAQRLITRVGGGVEPEEAARLMVARYLSDIDTPPTDLDGLMRKLDILECEPDNDLPGDGQLIKRPNGFAILYRPNQSRERVRWTIAHEMAHVLFHSTGRNYPRFGKELESLCNIMAAEMLMPADHFKHAFRDVHSLDAIFRALKTFEVSLESLAIRHSEFFGSVFLRLEKDEFRWIPRNAERVHAISEDGLGTLIAASRSEHSGTAEVWVAPRDRPWSGHSRKAEWRRIGKEYQTIFMIHTGSLIEPNP